MKKIFTIFALAVIGLSSCNNKATDKLNIPEGEYMLSGKRKLMATMECGMTEATFGKSLIINNGKIDTNPVNPLAGLETAHYSIKKLEDNNYLTTVFRPVAGDSATIQFSYDATNNQLVFLCESTKIIYQKQ